MFTLEQIRTAHAKVQSGADFPAYVQELIQLGIVRYSHYVCDGHTEYEGKDGFHIQSDDRYPTLKVAPQANKTELQHSLKIHQNGETDYLMFCRQAADAGVELWTLDMQAMTCVYYDKARNKMVEEKVPQL